ncbi:MAG: hypothetical protein U9N61_01310 [Euryarchaeota archaeon]|nr:hypothetical protein [Euryarchaeota archaeon]
MRHEGAAIPCLQHYHHSTAAIGLVVDSSFVTEWKKLMADIFKSIQGVGVA